jgi:cytoskeletal protein RodZ
VFVCAQRWLLGVQNMKNDRMRLEIARFSWTVGLVMFAVAGRSSVAAAAPFRFQDVSATQDSAATRAVGTVKSVTANSMVLTLDAGGETTVLIQDATKIVRVAPGQKDLKQATPIAAGDLQAGDRILVRGKAAEDGKSLTAASVIAMAGTDVAAKQAKDREEWQRHGLGGIVSAVDPAASTITLSVTAAGQKKTVVVNISKSTVLRRYASDSVKFDDAKPAALDRVQVGDQLRARGTRSAEGNELAADEVVSGTFRNISGTISSLDASAGTVVVQDLATKKPVTVKISPDSQLRKLPAPVAQRIAARLKGEAAPAGNTATTAGASTSPAGADAADRRSAGSGGQGSGGGQGGDLQQMLMRMPPATLADLQKGDAVMLVTTEGSAGGAATAITLLAGVEPILQASPKSQASILSPWSLGAAPTGDSGSQ